MPRLSDLASVSNEYVGEFKNNSLNELIAKYNKNNTDKIATNEMQDKFGVTKPRLNYENGTIGYTVPLNGGTLDSRLGADNLTIKYKHNNNDFNLRFGTAGNNSINWKHMF